MPLTALNPVEIYILKVPGLRLRIWLAVAMILVLAELPLPIAGITLWLVALPYMAMTETLARMLGEQNRAQRRMKSDHAGQAVLLAEREARVKSLEAELAAARSNPEATKETEEARTYRHVGLHPRAPEFVVTAARRAYRGALHPDRHPRNREEAHHRFLKAEAAFEAVAELRR